MKQRAAAGILMIAAILIFMGTFSSGQEQGIRKEAPLRGWAGAQFYYDPEINPFYPRVAPYYKRKDGYITGNCTWYAWGRACEIAGGKLPYVFTGNAGTWWEQNREKGWYPWGTEPKRGSIACYATHVAVVEQEDPLKVSESGWTVEKQKDPIVFHCGKPWREEVLGYIYVTEKAR